MGDGATVVLVHGAWHGAWCWERVTPLLDEAGVAHRELDLPLTSLDDDIAAVRTVLDEVDGPVVLCGHSYGGAVITGAGHAPNVRHLVYLTAFAVDEGESVAAVLPDAGLPATDLGSALVFADDGSITVDPTRADDFYHDCDPDMAAAAMGRLRPIQAATVMSASGPPAWRAKPTTYVVCTDDRAVHPELQRAMAERCGADVVEWPTAHSPFLNRPDLVADLLRERA